MSNADAEKLILELTTLRLPDALTRVRELLAEDRGFKKIDDNIYGWGDYLFKFALMMYAEREARAIKTVNDLEIHAAPKLARLVDLGEGEAVVVMNFPGCAGEFPVRIDRWNGPITAEAKSRFMDDMMKLAANGYFHPFAPKGLAHWEILPSSGEILLNSWSQLSAVDVYRLEELQESLQRLIDGLPG